jgi:outer membrane immunogenic protein
MYRTRLAFAGLLAFAAAYPAAAADMPVKRIPPAPAAAPAFSWTGFYIGGHVGAGWGTKEWTFARTDIEPREVERGYETVTVDGFTIPRFPFGEGSVNGFLAGGQVGFNWQTGPIVLGVEAEASWTNLEGRNTCIGPGSIFTIVGVLSVACKSEVDVLASLTGRVGFSFGQTMVFAKGGVAYASEEHSIRPALASLSPADVFCADTNCNFKGKDDDRWGWTFGAGVEHAFTPNWSAKVEYQFYDFDKEKVDFGHLELAKDLRIPIRMDIEQHVHVFKFGLNYRFGFAAAPVVAAY